MSEPKPLTEREAAKLYGLPKPDLFATLRERGLIAPEPVDPLLNEARKIVSSVAWEDDETLDDYKVNLALAALRRGMELAERPTLTLPKLKEVFDQCGWFYSEERIRELHVALNGGSS